MIVSDGWERDDTATVAREMARLARCAYAVVWVNPLKGHPDYEPLAGGMRAALPHVDRFLPGHNLSEPRRPGRRPRRHREEACGMKDILDDVERWRQRGEKVVVATVVATRRSAPRPVGAKLAVSEAGQLAGSVSGGCVEADVYENAREVLATGQPKLLSLRDRGRGGLVGRPSVRGRDRRVRRAARGVKVAARAWIRPP